MATLFPRTIQLQVRSGEYVNGIWTPAASVESSFVGSCQPTSGREFESMDVGRKDLGKIKVYSNTPLTISDQAAQTPGDIVLWQGSYWEVIAHMPYQNDLINHYKYLAEYRGPIQGD